MPPAKKKIPPEDVINEDSGPPITEPNNKKPGETEIDIDDAMIEEPKDDAFKNDPQKTPVRR